MILKRQPLIEIGGINLLKKKNWIANHRDILDINIQLELEKVLESDPTTVKTLPVIVQWTKGYSDGYKTLGLCCNQEYDQIYGQISLINSFYGELTVQTIEKLTNLKEISHIYLDRKVRISLDVASEVTGVRKVQSKEQLTGKGVTIAILDTGVYPHPDLITPHCRIVGFVDFINGSIDPYDDHGHGTHCAGTAVGNGISSQGLFRGSAPEASIVGVKVLDEYGSGKISTVIQGIEWCVNNKEKYGIKVISLSLGSKAAESYRKDPLAQAAQLAWHLGIMVCIAAGNEGPKIKTISSPGHDPIVLTIGAIDDKRTLNPSDHEIAIFSSRGPTPDGLIKPDLYAPGAEIVSLYVPGSEISIQFSEKRLEQHYIRLSGTSMATPFVAGIVALLLEENEMLSPSDLKSILLSSSRAISGEVAGIVDCEAALQLARLYKVQQQKK